MKITIKPYLVNLIKENSLYMISDVVLIFLIIIATFYNINKIFQNQGTVDKLTKDVQALQSKSTVLNSFLSEGGELDSDISLLNTLVPNGEDYFSIIYTLDEISRKTNFIITDYSVDLKRSNANKLRLTISGVGDRTVFLNFLKEYNFGGGRLITADKIELTPQLSGTIKIDVTFYNKNIVVDKNTQVLINSQSLEEVSKLKNKINFVIKNSSPEGELDLNYPKKSNPF